MKRLTISIAAALCALTMSHVAHAGGGACCLFTGGCEMVKNEGQCIDYNGTYMGDGTSCNDEPAHCAEEVWGACCDEWGDCIDLPDWECSNIGGSFHADVGCNENPCAPATGACCDESGNCSNLSDSDCKDIGGTFYEDVSCSEDPCMPPTGACCHSGGMDCIQLETANGPDICQLVYQGIWAGDGTNCDDVDCSDLDGCGEGLIEDCYGNCAPESWLGDGYCDDGQWTYNGVSIFLNCDEFDCDNDDCSCIPEEGWGACCNPDGDLICLELTESVCEIAGGTFHEGMSCGNAPCFAGACCFNGGSDEQYCANGYTMDACVDKEGEYLGNGSTCEVEGVECASLYGACCVDGTSCTEGLTEETCTEWGGYFYGSGSSCQDEGSLCQSGACCINDSGVPYCVETYLDDCWDYDGNWYGYGTDCTDVTDCDPGSYGACCLWGECHEMYQSECSWAGGSWSGGACESCSCTWPCGTCCTDGYCDENVSSDECEWAGGTFMGDVPCTEELCAPPPPTGACCVDGQCTIETEEDCSGLYLGDDMPCDNNPCGNDGGDGPFIGIQYDVLGTNLVDDDEETWTVDVYAVLADGCRLDAVAGDTNQSKMVTTTGSFYQNLYGGPTSQDINPNLFGTFPDLEYDSFVTIGLSDQNGNAMSDIGIDWTDFESGGAIESTDGSWYVTPVDAQGESGWFQDQFCEDNNGVRIARLTVRGLDSIVFVEALFQGKDVDGDTWQDSDLMAIAYDDCDELGSCVGDINLDGTVDVLDLLLVISDWGACSGSCPSDIDGNGAVDVLDLLEVIANWGPCPGEACSDGWDCAIGGDLQDYACGDGGGTCIEAFPSDDTTLGGTGIGFQPEGIGPLWRNNHSLAETFACAEPSINTLNLQIDIVNGMNDNQGTAIHTWDVLVNGTSVGQFSVVTGQDVINEHFSFSSIPAQAGGTYDILLQATNQVYSGGGSYHMAYTGSDDHSVELGNTSSCYCFGLADGSHACVELFSESCEDYVDCDEFGGCPDGYECVTSTCCGDPICMPLCD